MTPHIGLIGLGQMGLGMATTLSGKGFAVTGHDLAAPRRALAEQQGIATSEPEVILRQSDMLVLSLPLGRDVAAVLTGGAGLATRAGRRLIVLDTSTTDPATSRDLHRILAAAGHGHLDAPVSGGPAGAAAGTLTMMIGGDDADVAAARPVIDALASTAIHVGPSGAGNVAKLVNNMLVAAHMLTTGEALRLSEAAGVPAEAVLAVINAATGRSALSENHFPNRILSGRFDSGFSTGLMRKDVGLAADLAREAGLDLPLSQKVAALWLEDRSRVGDAEDFTRMAGYAPRAGATKDQNA